MSLIRDRGIQSRVQITGFSLSVCRVRRVVEIVDSYPCDHCYVCLCFAWNYFKSLRNYVTSLGAYLYKREHALRNRRRRHYFVYSL